MPIDKRRSSCGDWRSAKDEDSFEVAEAIGRITMRTLSGMVLSRHGIAAQRLMPVQELIADRLGLPPLVAGTLNVQLAGRYCVEPDARIEPEEYDGLECLKLQRCRIFGMRCCIMRPHKHEESDDASRVLEIMAPVHFRRDLGVQDGDSLDVEVEGDDAWWFGTSAC